MGILQKTVQEISRLKIQGATDVALASLEALTQDFKEKQYREVKTLNGKIEKLKASRPTEALLFNVLDLLLAKVKSSDDLDNLNRSIADLKERVLRAEEKIAENGEKLLKDGMAVFTHCHSTTVIEILRRARRRGKKFQVFLTETRPLYQGRITAKELLREGIEVTMVVDSAAPYIISKEDEVPIHIVLLGCDAIFPQKGVFNKVGSYGLTLSSYEAKIPVFVAGSLLKTSVKPLVIEKRRVREIWERKPRDLKILNLAFDFIPQRFISGIISEFGLVKPEKIFKLVSQNYSFVLK